MTRSPNLVPISPRPVQMWRHQSSIFSISRANLRLVLNEKTPQYARHDFVRRIGTYPLPDKHALLVFHTRTRPEQYVVNVRLFQADLAIKTCL